MFDWQVMYLEYLTILYLCFRDRD